MNKIKIALLALLAGVTMTSCEDILFDNVNPDKAHDISAKDGLPVVVFYAQQSVYDHSEYYIYLSQCFTGLGKSSIGSYSYKSEWEFLTMNRHPMWRRHHYDVGVNVKNMIKYSQAMGSPNYELIGRTIRLMSTQLCTDAFGDMPRSQSYTSNSPKYDTQASIYKWMLEEADALIKMYEDPAVTNAPNMDRITVKEDRVYAGDLEKWKGLVYALKARILLRNIPNIDRSPAMCDKIIAAADAAIMQWRKGDLMHGAWFGNEPRYKFDGGTNEENSPWSEAQPIINAWESRKNMLDNSAPSKFFLVDCLGLLNPNNETKNGQYENRNGYANDPRASLLMLAQEGPVTASSTSSSYKLRYLENNIGMGSSYKNKNYPKLFFGAYASSNASYNPIFTMEELYFIKAEATYWKGDKAGACKLVKEATENNIKRHLDDFLANNVNPNINEKINNIYPGGNGSTGITFEREEYWNAQLNAFLNNEELRAPNGRTIFVKKVTEKGNMHWFFNESEFSLSDLMIQKYIAMYMQPEQWTDLRRYHYSNKRNNYGIGDANEIVYPTLRRPYNLYAPYWIDGMTEAEKENAWVQRINYDPETEEKYNRAELERLGAYKNYKWLREPMIWSKNYGERSSLTED